MGEIIVGSAVRLLRSSEQEIQIKFHVLCYSPSYDITYYAKTSNLGKELHSKS
jgi:hypothetical protein